MRLKYLLTLSILIYGNLFGQLTNDDQYIKFRSKFLPKSGSEITQEQKPGHAYITTTKDGNKKITDIDLTETVNIIVEFKEDPLFIKQNNKSLSKVNSAFYYAQFSQFANDLNSLHQRFVQQIKMNLKNPEIESEFYKLFNGVSVTVPKGIINSLSSLNYVKKIYANRKVNAYVEKNISLIKADSLWQQFGTEGDSIVVGLIDTGIDYNNPALGGGIGKGHKVIGGYDFVDNDSDPMDDNGHGTHVAGIIAADGPDIKGVAPKARLMAFKVLDKYGNGLISTVISGIERAADPNDDGNTNDKVDIVNMSLGTSGEPDDALSITVNNGVNLGIVFCIAAGNNGDFTGSYTISSPGTAALAITVGASDNNDKLASFSSRGPTNLTYSIKPEVVAPGVDIKSLGLNNTFAIHSGTSMATPHVAGVCALLKRVHPDWGPKEIKSAIITTATDIGEEVMAQGAGRVDALSAAKASTLIYPALLSFGLDNINETNWNTDKKIMFVNSSHSTQNYSVTINGLQPGINISANPSSFNLPPGDSISVGIAMNINNAVLPFPQDSSTFNTSSYAYSGNIMINSTENKLHVPWAFVKAVRLYISYDKPYVDLMLANENHIYDIFGTSSPYSTEIIAAPGKYDLSANFFSSDSMIYVVKENLSLHGFDSIKVNSTDAIYSINLKGYDNNGNPVPIQHQYLGFTFPDSTRLITSYSGSWKHIFTSGVSSRFVFHPMANASSEGQNKAWVFDYDVQHGINSSMTLINDFKKYSEQGTKVIIPPHLANPQAVVGFGDLSRTDDGGFGIIWDQKYFNITGNAWEGNVYLPPPSTDPQINEGVYVLGISDSNRIQYFSPVISSYKDSIGFFGSTKPNGNICLFKKGEQLVLKNWLIYPDNFHINNYDGPSNISAHPYFYGQLNEIRYSDVYTSMLKIYNSDNQLVFNDTLYKSSSLSVPPGKYRTELTNSNYYIEGHKGYATLTSKYDLTLNDPNPPVIKSMQIRNSKGIPESRVEVNEKATLYFAALDYRLINMPPYIYLSAGPVLDDSSSVYTRLHGSSRWVKVKVNKISEDTLIGCYYSADLSNYTGIDSTALDIKLVLYDQSGNNLQYTLEPALAVGKFKGIPGVDDEDHSGEIPGEYVLFNNYPNPFNPSTTISYSLPEDSKVTIDIFNVLGQKVTRLFEGSQVTGQHKQIWNAQNCASGIYFCRFNADGRTSFTKIQKLILIK